MNVENKSGKTYDQILDSELEKIGLSSIYDRIYLFTSLKPSSIIYRHKIIQSELKKFLGIVDYTKNTTIAEIISEPKKAKKQICLAGPRYDGLEIIIKDPLFEGGIRNIVNRIGKKLGEPIKVTLKLN